MHATLTLGRMAMILVVLTLGTAMAGCDTGDASSIRIVLGADFTGEVLTSSVGTREPGDGPAQRAISGADWAAAGTLVVARGTFTDVTKLNVGGITFVATSRPGAPVLRLTIPRGPEAQWPQAFTVIDPARREATAKALDPKAKVATVGENIKIVVSVPGTVISAGSDFRGKGVNSSFEETLATLVVPAEIAASPGPPILWDITWKQQTVR